MIAVNIIITILVIVFVVITVFFLQKYMRKVLVRGEGEITEILKKEIGDDIDVVYSVGKELTEKAIEGTAKFVQKVDEFWGNADYVSEEVVDPTWLEITKLADEMIKTTGDYQHKFLEGIKKVGDDRYTFVMGS